MKKYIMLFLLASSSANALDTKLTWTKPVTRESGAPLAASEILQYEIEYVNLATNVRRTKIAKATLTGYTIPGIEEVKYSFRIRAYDTGNLISQWSNQVIKDYGAVVTQPPQSPQPPQMCACPCP